ncbi:peptidoglycan-associated lipoprotein Pal [Rickettsiella massiliensis]|uniref:peptidoglycan-associated lipoprotein Pal n=1 Tax=Rickettsiella massiliensis TaxID=676517 RepID=UPI00029AA403|nr:peptidoglycan-associated lipoprotein Pal [Rickettsiella massiliensis]
MLIKKSSKVISLLATFLLLAACATEKGQLDAMDTHSSQEDDQAQVQGADMEETEFDDQGAVHPLKVGNQIYYFAFDKSTLQSRDIPSLKVQARYLLMHPRAKVLIDGHTDERGSREYNIGLGNRRALSIARFLRAQGVSQNQILTVSYGAEKPVAFGHSEADYARNRRANLQYQTPIITDQD